MKRAFFAVLLALTLLSVFPIIPGTLRPVHGLSEGVVCVAPITSTTCDPSKPGSFSGVNVGSTLTVAVNISNSSALNGFAISLKVNTTILNPVNATADGSIVPTLSGTVFTANPSNCVNNVGTGCSNVDGPGVTTFAFLSVGGISVAPTTGRLFEASYKVMGTTGANGTNIGFVVSSLCTGTSIPNTCVNITNGTPTPDTESLAEPGIFATGAGTSYFSIAANPVLLSIAQGASARSNITVTSIGSFYGIVRLNATVLPTVTNGPTATLAASSVTVPAGGTANDTLTVFTALRTPADTYTINVNATGTTASSTVQITVIVAGPDFRLTANPSSLNVFQSGNVSSTITVTSLNGFAGNVTLTAVASTLTIAKLTLSPRNVTLSPGASVNATLTISIPNGVINATYSFVVTGTSGHLVHFIGVYVTVIIVPDFALSSTTPILTVSSGSSNSATITVIGRNGFQGTINITAPSPQGLETSFSPNPVVLTPTSQLATVTLNITATSTTAVRNYTLTITGTNGTVARYTTITVRVADVSLSSNVGQVRIGPGTSYALIITVTSLNGFNGTATITATVAGAGLIVICSPNTVTVKPGNSASCTLTVSVPAGTAPGTYTVTVTARQGSVSHSLTLPVTVVPPPESTPSTILGLPSVDVYAILAVSVAIILGLLVVAVSRSRRRSIV